MCYANMLFIAILFTFSYLPLHASSFFFPHHLINVSSAILHRGEDPQPQGVSTEKHKCVHVSLSLTLIFPTSFTDWQRRGCHDGIDQQARPSKESPHQGVKRKNPKRREQMGKRITTQQQQEIKPCFSDPKKNHVNDGLSTRHSFLSCDWWR